MFDRQWVVRGSAALILCGLFLALGARGTADDKKKDPANEDKKTGLRIDTPQQGYLMFPSGQVVAGIVVSLDAKEIKFKRLGRGVPITYKLKEVKKVQLTDGIYVYDKDNGFVPETGKEKDEPLVKDKEAPKDKGDKVTVDFSDVGAKKPDPEQTVIAEGVGKDADEAIKDALRNAVRQVVGAVVDAETLEKNDEIISDKVLTYSDGMVRKYDKISEKEVKGLTRIKIKAIVERRSVVARLRKANVAVKDVEGKDLAATVMTRAEARANATALLSKELRQLPNVLMAEVRKPRAEDYDEDKNELTLDVTVKADMKKYEAFVKRFTGLLDKVSLAKDSAIIRATPTRPNRTKDAEAMIWQASKTPLAGPDLSNSAKDWCVWVVSGVDQQYLTSKWNCYVVDSNCAKTLDVLQGKLTYHVTLSDGEGQLITEDEGSAVDAFAVISNHGSWLARSMVGQRRNRSYHFSSFQPARRQISVTEDQTVSSLIAPLAFFLRNGSELSYVPAYIHHRKIKLTQQELKKIKEIKSEIVFRPDNPAKDD